MEITLFDKLKRLEQISNVNYWSQRIIAELLYLGSLSKVKGGCYNQLLEETVDYLISQSCENCTIIKSDALKAEDMLSSCAIEAKKITCYCISHAHIDMNWMWGYQETASITVDTFRTVLNLMKEYPDFTYSQSQASVYKIIEKYAPEMIDEIKQRIHEGRWELSASTWVETDKNMPNGESLSRHILYTKCYLSKLFDIDPSTLKLDFEPDTFGHNINVPEILQNGGIDYYYHCRGYDKYFLYRWRSPSGKEILVNREAKWYNAAIEPKMFTDAPLFCDDCKVDVILKVYGVGDHGGGPTRRDIESIIDIRNYPLYPTIKFGTYHEYFQALEKFRSILPIFEGELNFVFTGCYTTQTKIKMSNRVSEDRLYEAETLSAADTFMTGAASKASLYSKAWENVMFNHFHDILPGSGVVETREYALGLFQDTLAYVNINANTAMRDISASIDTSALPFDEDNITNSEGGGVGFAVSHGEGHKLPQAERGRGKTRVIHLFNTTAYDRKEPVEVTIWDYSGDIGKIIITEADGTPTTFQFSGNGQHYWGHNYSKFIIDAKIPAFGYSTYILKESNYTDINSFRTATDPRCDNFGDDDLILENDSIKAIFNSETAMLVSLTDKESGQQLISPDKPSCIFRFIKENTRYGMTAWRVGPYMQIINLNKDYPVKVTDYRHEALRKYINYEIKFLDSKLNVSVSLNNDSKLLNFKVDVDWHEIGSQAAYIPQLNFYMPVAYAATNYKYDIPFGIINRNELMYDVPANSLMSVMNKTSSEKSMCIITDSKYGFRGCENSGAVTLIRGAYDPDPYPEIGQHHFKLGVCVTCGCDLSLKKSAACYIHEISFASGTKQSGNLPLSGSFLKVEGSIVVSSIKNSEDGEGLIIRVSDFSGKQDYVKLIFAKEIKSACLTDINETPKEVVSISANTAVLPIKPYSIATIKIIL